MKEIGPDDSVQITKGKHGLSYSPEFKNWLKQHPRAMSQVADLIEKIIYNKEKDTGYELTEGDIKVIYSERPYSDIFEVTVGNDKFFVKRDSSRKVSSTGGQFEYNSSMLAKERLNNYPDIETINFQLGYTNKDSNIAYFVSKWEDLESVEDYLSRSDLKSEERKEIKEKLCRIMEIFPDFSDVKKYNMFYDPNTKKIKMFDLNIHYS